MRQGGVGGVLHGNVYTLSDKGKRYLQKYGKKIEIRKIGHAYYYNW
jgi:DNA-binding PadR family transcriptional regulator